MCFAADDEVVHLFGHAVQWVIGVCEAPVVEGRAVVVVWPCGFGGRGSEVQPLAFAAVEVLFDMCVSV